MTSDAPQPVPAGDGPFTPDADADLAADPETGQGPGGTSMLGAEGDAGTPTSGTSDH